jgi:hypothetical protein
MLNQKSIPPTQPSTIDANIQVFGKRIKEEPVEIIDITRTPERPCKLEENITREDEKTDNLIPLEYKNVNFKNMAAPSPRSRRSDFDLYLFHSPCVCVSLAFLPCRNPLHC